MPDTGATKTLVPELTFEMLNDDAVEVLNGSKTIAESYRRNGIDDVVSTN